MHTFQETQSDGTDRAHAFFFKKRIMRDKKKYTRKEKHKGRRRADSFIILRERWEAVLYK